MLIAPERKLPALQANLNPENRRFFDAAKEGKLLVGHCSGCGQFHFYPRTLCPHCFSDRTEWRAARGTGTLYTYTVFRRGVPIPFSNAYVTLDEGVTMLTCLVDCDLDALHIGQRVRVVFKTTEGGEVVPMFTTAQA